MYKSTKVQKEKKEPAENIKEYENHNKICVLTKPRSPHSILFVEDINDDWFIYVKTYRTKSGIITNSSMIIKSDYDTWLGHLLRLGWEITKIFTDVKI